MKDTYKQKNSKSFKRKIRARMAETGEKYTTAMRALMNENGDKFCDDCPDREACATGHPCNYVRIINAQEE